MKKLNLMKKENQKRFGVSVTAEQDLYLRKRLERLQELSPSCAKLILQFEKRKSSYKGTLKINSFSEKFESTKIGPDPVQTFFLIEEEIEEKLRDWKRTRFSHSLFNEFTKQIPSNQTYA